MIWRKKPARKPWQWWHGEFGTGPNADERRDRRRGKLKRIDQREMWRATGRILPILLLALVATAASAADPECVNPPFITDWDGTDGDLAYCTPLNTRVDSCTTIFDKTGVFAAGGVKSTEVNGTTVLVPAGTVVRFTHVLEGVDTYRIRCANELGTSELSGIVTFTAEPEQPVEFPDPARLL